MTFTDPILQKDYVPVKTIITVGTWTAEVSLGTYASVDILGLRER
jgi:hypothetical protein